MLIVHRLRTDLNNVQHNVYLIVSEKRNVQRAHQAATDIDGAILRSNKRGEEIRMN